MWNPSICRSKTRGLKPKTALSPLPPSSPRNSAFAPQASRMGHRSTTTSATSNAPAILQRPAVSYRGIIFFFSALATIWMSAVYPCFFVEPACWIPLTHPWSRCMSWTTNRWSGCPHGLRAFRAHADAAHADPAHADAAHAAHADAWILLGTRLRL